jgi:hypothetical protein
VTTPACLLPNVFLGVWFLALFAWFYSAYCLVRARRYFEPRTFVQRWLSPFARYIATNYRTGAEGLVARARNSTIAFVGLVALGSLIAWLATRVGAACAL